MYLKMKYFRNEVGLTQYELSEVAKVPRYKIQLAEQGIPCLTQDEGKRILKKLGLDSESIPDWMTQLIDSEELT